MTFKKNFYSEVGVILIWTQRRAESKALMNSQLTLWERSWWVNAQHWSRQCGRQSSSLAPPAFLCSDPVPLMDQKDVVQESQGWDWELEMGVELSHWLQEAQVHFIKGMSQGPAAQHFASSDPILANGYVNSLPLKFVWFWRTYSEETVFP